MTKFNQSEVRSTVAAVLLTFVCSTTLVLGAVGPAGAITPAPAVGPSA